MLEVNFKDWKFEVDSNLTRKTYEMESGGSADSCECAYCINFRKQRKSIYPLEIKSLFENLGIDLNKEVEVSEVYQLKNGLHNYSGWFHFVGKIISGIDSKDKISGEVKLIPINDNFSIGFSQDNSSNVKVWFETDVPMTLEKVN